jgi:PKD repeat protein
MAEIRLFIQCFIALAFVLCLISPVTAESISIPADSTTMNLTTMTTPYSDSAILPPAANFTANATSGNAPFLVQFNNTSSGNVTTHAWDFNNDGSVDSMVENPVHTYTNPGMYTVNLTVIGPGGSDSKVRTDYIAVTAKPVASRIPSFPFLDGNRTSFIYPDDGNRTSPIYPDDGNRTSSVYPDGNRTSSVYPDGNRTSSVYPDGNRTSPLTALTFIKSILHKWIDQI